MKQSYEIINGRKLKKCFENQIRNPITLRCRKIKIKQKKESVSSSYKDTDSSLKPYSYYNNIKRFENYNIIINYLKEINLKDIECINLYKENNKYIVANNILLNKRIGTESLYGIVFKCVNINKKYGKIPKFTAKIQLNSKELKKELKILNELSNIGIKESIPCLPIIYTNVICNMFPKNDDRYPKLLLNIKKNIKGYSIIFNELASGDLKSFIKYKYSSLMDLCMWKNLYEQIFISLATIHSFGILHNDAHWGNFLYHKIKPGGCFHYEINGIDFYIENIGFIWSTWDYGLVSKIYRHGDYINDIMRIDIILRKRNLELEKNVKFKKHDFYKEIGKSGILPDNVLVSKEVIELQNKIFKHIVNDLKPNTSNHIIIDRNLTEDLWLKYLLDNDILFSKVPIGKILSSSKLTFYKYDKNILIGKKMKLHHLIKE
jgi:hypothetical protein